MNLSSIQNMVEMYDWNPAALACPHVSQTGQLPARMGNGGQAQGADPVDQAGGEVNVGQSRMGGGHCSPSHLSCTRSRAAALGHVRDGG